MEKLKKNGKNEKHVHPSASPNIEAIGMRNQTRSSRTCQRDLRCMASKTPA
jgi:hypothetical protein